MTSTEVESIPVLHSVLCYVYYYVNVYDYVTEGIALKTSSKVYNSQIQTSDFTNIQDFTRVHNLFTIGRAIHAVQKNKTFH